MSTRGRPPIDPEHGTVPLSVRVSVKAFDALCVQAHRESVSVPELMREALQTFLTKPRPPSCK